jgi:hypothetical protein
VQTQTNLNAPLGDLPLARPPRDVAVVERGADGARVGGEGSAEGDEVVESHVGFGSCAEDLAN